MLSTGSKELDMTERLNNNNHMSKCSFLPPGASSPQEDPSGLGHPGRVFLEGEELRATKQQEVPR